MLDLTLGRVCVVAGRFIFEKMDEVLAAEVLHLNRTLDELTKVKKQLREKCAEVKDLESREAAIDDALSPALSYLYPDEARYE